MSYYIFWMIDALPDMRERRVISERFGLCGKPRKTQEAVGRGMKLCDAMIGHIERKALDRLRKWAGRHDLFNEYYA